MKKIGIAGMVIFLVSARAGGQVQGVWSGTISMEVHSTTVTGTKHAVFHMTIQDNYVTGSMEGMDSAIIEGKFYTAHKSQGAGKGELVKVWFYEDGTYEIHVESCQFSQQNDEGGWGDPSTLPLATYNQPVKSRDLLSGTRTETTDLGGLGTQTTTVTWHLSRTSGATLIVIPEMYDDWMPEPGRDELTRGSTIKITFRLEGLNGAPLKSKCEKFELRLSGTSHEPGITINMPATPLGDLPDIRIIPQPNATMVNGFQGMDINCPGCTTGSAVLACYDGGGYTTLTVDAIMEGAQRIHGTLLTPTGISEIPIPKRDIGSHIAKKWSDQYNNPGDKDDQEQSNGNSNDGDGLTAYEEYRGVISEGSFKRLDPQKKELGVWVTKNESQFFSEGFEWFENASGVKVIKFLDDEIIFDRKLNRNSPTYHRYDQYAIKVSLGPLDPGVVGRAVHQPGNWGPKSTRVVLIDWSQMQDIYQKWVKEASPDQLLFSLTDDLASTVAHELAHGVDVHHHGPNCTIIHFLTARESSDTIWRIFKSDGTEITTRPFELEQVGSNGCQESGDISCLMTYNPFHKWSYKLGADKAWIFNEVPHLALGKGLCTSGKGTGINAGVLYFGDSPRGNCKGQVQLKPN